jgi:hypothetical protein
LSHGSGSSSPITRRHLRLNQSPRFCTTPGKSHRIAHPHSTRLGSLGSLDFLASWYPQISPASRTDCVGSVCNLSNLQAAGSARSMILDSLRLLHALSLSAPATACHAPSTEGACPRLTSSQRLDSAWGSLDYHRRCARCTQHAARTHAPTRYGIRGSGRPSDQTSPNTDHVGVVANPVSRPARDRGRPTPSPVVPRWKSSALARGKGTGAFTENRPIVAAQAHRDSFKCRVINHQPFSIVSAPTSPPASV